MRDYKVYLQNHRQEGSNRLVDAVSAVLALAMLVVMVWLICISLVDGVVAQAEIEDEKAKSWLAHSYDRPLAYRLASPTTEQMERTEALLTLQPLVRK